MGGLGACNTRSTAGMRNANVFPADQPSGPTGDGSHAEQQRNERQTVRHMFDLKAAALTDSQELCALAGRRQRDHAAPAGPAPSAYACARFSCATGHGLAQNVIRSAGAVRCGVVSSVCARQRRVGMAGRCLRRANGLRTRASLGLGYDVQCGVNARLHRRGDGGRRGSGTKAADDTRAWARNRVMAQRRGPQRDVRMGVE